MNWKWLWLLMLVPMSFFAFISWDHLRGPLGGLVVVIDPGHGGNDPGSSGVFGKDSDQVTIREDEYVYDVACRLKEMIESLGGSVVFTISDKVRSCAIDARPPNEGIPSDQNELFTLDDTPVSADQTGLAKRTHLANKVLEENWWKRVVFISIHFDAIGVPELEGVHFVAPEDGDREVIDQLLVSFKEAGRLQKKDGIEYAPVKYSGDSSKGMRRIYVLSPQTNNIRQRVLVELGNFTNPKDVWRIRDPDIRQDYAQRIAQALIELNKLPVWEVRK